MPELIEVEAYRVAAQALVGRQIAGVRTPDPAYVRRGDTESLRGSLCGRAVVGVARLGKLLCLELDDTHRLGLRFGMTGRLVVDGSSPIERLLYSPSSDAAVHTRFGLDFTPGGSLQIVDPRRLGSVELDPDTRRLGPDAAAVTAEELTAAMRSTQRPVKALLLDQARVAGIGNLLADESLWRAGMAPTRSVDSLGVAEVEVLAEALRGTIAALSARGGSHTGDLQEHRRPGGVCPRCGGPLRRSTVGGRTTVWCPECQR